jgi:hypothetical protein
MNKCIPNYGRKDCCKYIEQKVKVYVHYYKVTYGYETPKILFLVFIYLFTFHRSIQFPTGMDKK